MSLVQVLRHRGSHRAAMLRPSWRRHCPGSVAARRLAGATRKQQQWSQCVFAARACSSSSAAANAARSTRAAAAGGLTGPLGLHFAATGSALRGADLMARGGGACAIALGLVCGGSSDDPALMADGEASALTGGRFAAADSLVDADVNAILLADDLADDDGDDDDDSVRVPSSSKANAVAAAAASDEEDAAAIAAAEAARRRRARGPSTWALVLRLCWQDAIAYVAAVGFSVATALLSISEANIMKSLFDSFTGSRRRAASGGEAARAESPAPSTSTPTDIRMAVLKLFAVVLGEAVCATLASSCLASATNSLKQRLREHLLDKLLQQDEAYFDARAVGAITDQVNEHVNEIGTALRVACTGGVRSLVTLVGGSISLVQTSPQIGGVFVALLPTMAIVANALSYGLRNLRHTAARSAGEANALLTEAMSNVRIIHSFTAEAHTKRRYHAALNDASRAKVRLATVTGAVFAVVKLGSNAIMAAICAYGGYLVQSGKLTSGDVAKLLAQAIRVQSAASKFSTAAVRTTQALSASLKIDIPETPTIVAGEGLRPDRIRGAIVVEDVHFVYPQRPQQPVLRGLSLEIKPNSFVALVGASGGGKSTLSALLVRFYDPASGAILLDGRDLRGLDPRWIRQQIGYVEQTPTMFAGTIRDNILYGCPTATDEQVERAARQANAHDFIEGFPLGYDTEIGEKGAQLSGGQRQRIAIARALVKNPKILILDEPTGALDGHSERLIGETLEELRRGGHHTVIVIAHRLSTVRMADTIAVVKHGRVVEHGTHHDLLRRGGGQYSRLFQAQASSA